MSDQTSFFEAAGGGRAADPELEEWIRAHNFPPLNGKATVSYWRGSAHQIIERILERTEGMEPSDRLKAIDDAYPFGTRKGWPYRCWLKERGAVKTRLLGP